METSVQELIDMLYTMVQDAWGVPLGAEKCVIDRDKVLDLLDEIKAQLPGEINEAKRLVAARNEYVNNAKREAESIRKVAEERARQLIDEQEVVRAAKQRANSITSEAEKKSSELRQVANRYADDTLLRTEQAITEALNEVQQARSRFRSLSGTTGNDSTGRFKDIDIEA